MSIANRSVCLLLLLGLGCAQASTELLPGVHLIRGAFVPGTQPDGNSLLFEGPAGWVLFDSGRHVGQVRAVLDAIEGSNKSLTDLVNSHWHLDHVSGNPLLRRKFPQMQVHAGLAVREATSGFLANYRKQLLEQLERTDLDAATRKQYDEEIQRIDAGPALFPDRPVLTSETRQLAGRGFELHLETRAVTGTDVWLYDPDSEVLAAGDLLTLPAPFFDTACATRWQQSLGRIEAAPFQWLVPGHGSALRRSEVSRYRRAFDSLLACAGGSASAQLCGQAWVRNLGPLLPDSEQEFAKSMIVYYVEQQLRNAKAQQAACE